MCKDWGLPSGVWNMPLALRSSLVGLPVPGLGDAGALTRLMGAGRLAGPIEALALALFAPFNPPGAGDGDGLVDGGRKEDIVLVDGDQKSEFAVRKTNCLKNGFYVGFGLVCGSTGGESVVFCKRSADAAG